jgi:hypothetical protein
MKLYRSKNLINTYLIGDLKNFFKFTFNVGKGFRIELGTSPHLWEYNNITKINNKIYDYIDCNGDFFNYYKAWKILKYNCGHSCNDILEEITKILFNQEIGKLINIYIVYNKDYQERYIIGNIDGDFLKGVALPFFDCSVKMDLFEICTPVKHWKSIEKVSLVSERMEILHILMHKVHSDSMPDELFEILERKLRDVS